MARIPATWSSTFYRTMARSLLSLYPSPSLLLAISLPVFIRGTHEMTCISSRSFTRNPLASFLKGADELSFTLVVIYVRRKYENGRNLRYMRHGKISS